MKVATHLVFAECCWFATSAVFDVNYEVPSVLVAAATSLLPDADYRRAGSATSSAPSLRIFIAYSDTGASCTP